PVLVEGRVIESEVRYRPRRQLLCHLGDGAGVLTLRFFHFHPGQVRQFAPGARVRAFGEVRQGYHGAEMAHPRYRLVAEGTPLARALTPVYPTTAGLPQDTLRRLIAGALAECDLSETLPASVLEALGLPTFREAVLLLHTPPARVARDLLETRRHPA